MSRVIYDKMLPPLVTYDVTMIIIYLSQHLHGGGGGGIITGA